MPMVQASDGVLTPRKAYSLCSRVYNIERSDFNEIGYYICTFPSRTLFHVRFKAVHDKLIIGCLKILSPSNETGEIIYIC